MATKTTKENSITVYFDVEKPTKNTIKFAESKADEFAPTHMGTVYVQKATLGSLNYTAGKKIRVTLEVVD